MKFSVDEKDNVKIIALEGKIMGTAEDELFIDKIYEKTKILLMPSKVREAFGRTAIEALYNYIPVISSNLGGLNESNVNSELVIDNINDIEKWNMTIKKVLSDYKKYVQDIDLMKLEKFKKNKQINKFKEIVDSLKS